MISYRSCSNLVIECFIYSYYVEPSINRAFHRYIYLVKEVYHHLVKFTISLNVILRKLPQYQVFKIILSSNETIVEGVHAIATPP